MYNFFQLDIVDTDRLQKEIEDVLGHWPPDGNTPRQTMLQGLIDQTDVYYGTGRLDTLKHSETEFCHTLHSTPYINSLLKEFGMHRSRIMIMNRGVYSWHYDPSYRLHIPVLSNHSNNFMVIDDEVHRMPVGSIYFTNTTKMHTYVNTSDETRVHIIGCVDKDDETINFIASQNT